MVDFQYLIKTKNNATFATVEQISFNLTFVIAGGILGSLSMYLQFYLLLLCSFAYRAAMLPAS